jgi:hypothetical protein
VCVYVIMSYNIYMYVLCMYDIIDDIGYNTKEKKEVRVKEVFVWTNQKALLALQACSKQS